MSFIRILTLNRQDDADEVFQMTCMVLWQKFAQYDPEGDFGAWACRMAHYETLKNREAKGRIKLLSDEALELVAEAAMPITAELSERRTALADCIKQLPTTQHTLIRDKYFNGVSVERLASRAGRSTHAIYRELGKVHGVLMRCVHRKVTEGLS